jgi:FtsP/CotA-like multicopper oxidase with cupredoxin domain
LTPAGARILSLENVTVATGQAFDVAVALAADGTENALGFSLEFDPKLLSFAGANLDTAIQPAYSQVNANNAAAGRVGFVLSKGIDETFAAGTAGLFRVRFVAAGATGTATLTFGDSPVVREVASVIAEVQPASYTAGAVKIVGAGRLALTLQQGKCSLSLSGETGVAYVLQACSDLVHWTDLSIQTVGTDGVLKVDQPEAAQFPSRFYRLVPQR